jgi:GT2 family glycosyltransferase
VSQVTREKAQLPDAPVIVLNWNGWDYTLACLRSLREAHDARIVWLVDNASEDDRLEEVTQIWPGVKVLRLDQNYGFAGGMNRALRLAASDGYEYAYLLNNDSEVVPGFLRAALDVAQRENAAVVGSRIAYTDSSDSLLFDGEYHVPGKRPISAPSETKPVAHANGAGMLVRLDALASVGYFDERFFCYHEEVDLCWRLAASGLPSLVAPRSLIRHHRAGSDVDGNSVYYRTRNQFLLAEHFRGWRKFKRHVLYLYEASIAGRRAARVNDSVTWRALAAAVDDGIHGRFGRRPMNDLSRAARMRFRVLYALMPFAGVFLRHRTERERSDPAQGAPRET